MHDAKNVVLLLEYYSLTEDTS